MNSKLKTGLKTVGFFTFGFIVLYLVYYYQNAAYLSELVAQGEEPNGKTLFQKILTSFSEAKLIILVAVLLCFMISNVSRALRWQMLLEPIHGKTSFVNAISSIMAAYLVNLGIPRSGEFVRAGLFAKYENIAPEKVMGTIVTDRVVDVLSLLIVIFLACVFSFNDIYNYYQQNTSVSEGPGNKYIVGIGIFAILIMVASYWLYRRRAYFLNTKAGKKLIKIIKGFYDGLKSIFQLKNPYLFIFHSVMIWLMYYLMTYLSFFAIDATAHLNPVAGLVVFVFGSLGFVFPAPGGIGSYQYLVTEALTNFYGIGIGDASSFANIVFFTVSILCNVFFGIIAFILLPVYNSQYTPYAES